YCNYFPRFECEALTAIAWLEKDSIFEKGPVEETFYGKLCELVSDPWQPVYGIAAQSGGQVLKKR
ncbi:MAG TPA: hypothetical protein VKD65_03020, partial [Candidatus Angelobacter sp.]|nr:hypothetical protein [Candidatus Angelobacter sp.]